MKACIGKKLNSFTSMVKFQQGKVNNEKTMLSLINLCLFTNSFSTSSLSKYRMTKIQIFVIFFGGYFLYIFIFQITLTNQLIYISDA